jgi:hypothetical protein
MATAILQRGVGGSYRPGARSVRKRLADTNQEPTMPRSPDADRPSGPEDETADTDLSATGRKAQARDDDQTRVSQDGESSPRMPHERDTSADSQRHPGGGAPRVGRQAHEDVERGLVDTDRAPVTQKVYDRVKGP